MAEFTEGVMGDGAVILKDGVPLTIAEVLEALNMPPNIAAIDTQVVTATVQATPLTQNPKWLWCDDRGRVTYGRWARGSGQSAYVRLDIILDPDKFNV